MIREILFNLNDIFVLYDVCVLFINVLFDEIIEIIVEKVFKNNWFNEMYGFNFIKIGFIEFLRIVIKD